MSELGAGHVDQSGSDLEIDPRRRSGGNCLEFLQSLLPLGADMLQHAPLRLPLEVIVHHLVQRLVVISIVNIAFEAGQLSAMSRKKDVAGPALPHGAPPHAHLLQGVQQCCPTVRTTAMSTALQCGPQL